MKKNVYFIYGILAMIMASCQAIEEPLNHGLSAIIESNTDTKTSLSYSSNNRYTVLWSEGDKIGVFVDEDDSSSTFTLQSGAGTKRGTFVGDKYGNNYCAVYPQSIVKSRAEDILFISLPQEQKYKPDNFDDDTYPMVAVSNSSQLQFKNLCSILRISLVGTELVSKIVFKPNDPTIKVSGSAYLDVSSSSGPVLTMAEEAYDTVTLTTGSVQLSDIATYFNIVLPPQTYKGGFTVLVYSGDRYIEKKYCEDFTMERSMLHNASAFTFDKPISRYLTFTSEGTTILSMNVMTEDNPVFYYSYDTVDWTLWDFSSLPFNSSTPLYICGDNPTGICGGGPATYIIPCTFVASGDKFSITGDIMSLVNNIEAVQTIPRGYCFAEMFANCDLLVKGPQLPATDLTKGCYAGLFINCVNLIEAPELPATTLFGACYRAMFYGCENLVKAPTLPAVNLDQGCYDYMFYGCTKLAKAPELPATTLTEYCYQYMFMGCSGLTQAPALPATTLENRCYCAMFYGCTSLKEAPSLPATKLAYECYGSMFANCTNLTEAPALPATELESCCYWYMFWNCSSLTKAPALPATTLANGCYQNMFWNCSSLTEAPALPATTLVDSFCYSGMFCDCISLKKAPELPATELGYGCYQSMFSRCTSLTEAPILPATTLQPLCYNCMFLGCTSLTEAPALPATTLAPYCYARMFQFCPGLKKAPELPAATLEQKCYEQMFDDCYNLNYVKCLAIDITAPDCLNDWLNVVASTGTFVKASSMNAWPVGSSGIPSGWKVISYE